IFVYWKIVGSRKYLLQTPDSITCSLPLLFRTRSTSTRLLYFTVSKTVCEYKTGYSRLAEGMPFFNIIIISNYCLGQICPENICDIKTKRTLSLHHYFLHPG